MDEDQTYLESLLDERAKIAQRAFAVNGTRWDLTKYEKVDDRIKRFCAREGLTYVQYDFATKR